MSYTPKQVAELHDRNENFRGRRADFGKLQKYWAIKNQLSQIIDGDPRFLNFEEFEPNLYEKNSLMYVDADPNLSFADLVSEFQEVIANSDRIVINSDSQSIRFCFCVEDIWVD